MRPSRYNLANPVESIGRRSLTVTHQIYAQLFTVARQHQVYSSHFTDDFYSVCIEPTAKFEDRQWFSCFVCSRCLDIIRRRDLSNLTEFTPALSYLSAASGLGKVEVHITREFEIVTLETSQLFRYIDNGFSGFTLRIPIPNSN